MGAALIPLMGQPANIQSPSQVAGSVLGVQDLAAQVRLRQQQNQAAAMANEQTQINMQGQKALSDILRSELVPSPSPTSAIGSPNQPATPSTNPQISGAAAPSAPAMQPGAPSGQLAPGLVGVDQGALTGATPIAAPTTPVTPIAPQPAAPKPPPSLIHTDSFLQRVKDSPDLTYSQKEEVFKSALAQKTALAKLTTDQLDATIKNNNVTAGMADAVLQAPQDQKDAVWAQTVKKGQAMGLPEFQGLDPNKYIGDDQVKVFRNLNLIHTEAALAQQHDVENRKADAGVAAQTIGLVVKQPDPTAAYQVWRNQRVDPSQYPAKYYPGVENDVNQIGLTAQERQDQPKKLAEVAEAQRKNIAQELSGVTDQAGLDEVLSKHPDVKDIPKKYDPDAISNYQKTAVPIQSLPEYEIAQRKSKMGITGNNDFETVFLPAYAAKLGKTITQLTPDEKIQSFSSYAQARTDPEVRASLLSSRNTAEALKQMQLGQQPQPEQAAEVARDIIAHKIAPEQVATMFGGFGTAGQAFKRMVYTEAKKIDPNFNYEQASAEYGLVKSPQFQNTIRYMDSVINSVPRLLDSANKLGNTSVKAINDLINSGKNQFNNVDLKQFQTDRVLVGDEIAKILQGGGTGNGTSDAKLKQAQDLLSSSDSPAAIAKALKEVQILLGNRRGSLVKGTYMENSQPDLPKGNGGIIDKETAALFYKAAGGDPKKAQKLAEDNNWKVQ